MRVHLGGAAALAALMARDCTRAAGACSTRAQAVPEAIVLRYPGTEAGLNPGASSAAEGHEPPP